jgi:hypothetical protein
VLAVELVCFQYGFMKVPERLGMPDGYIPVNTLVLFIIDPEF